MKVAWVSHSAELGGAELSLEEGVRALVQRGHEVDAILPGDGPLERRLAAAGAYVVLERYPLWVSAGRWRAPGHRGKRVVAAALDGRGLARTLGRLGPDVVVTNTIAVCAGALASRSRGLPHVWYVHEFGRDDHGLRFDVPERLAHRIVRALSDEVMVDSPAVGRAVAPWTDPARTSVVHYAVDVPDVACREIGDDAPLRLVLLGRRAPGKRQEDAVRALALLAADGVDAQLELVGGADPVYARRLDALAHDLGVAGRIRTTNFTTDPAARLAAADVALMCSRAEAFGRVTVEAMKLGRPVVGAAAGGTRDLIDDGRTGLLYAPGSASALAAALGRLDADRALLRRLGRQARSWSRATFTRDRYADDLLRVLGRAIDRARRLA